MWSRAGASLDIALARHFYQTAWFRAAALLCAAFAVALGYRLRVRRLEARERLRTALVEAQLDALQFQLRPHFLFNTLNSIMPLIGKDPERARQMVVRLGDLLRLSLRSEDTPLVTLEQEIAILEKYLSIEKVRFRDRLEVEIAIEPGVAAANVPSFLLQPLVENAIKHGLAGRAGRGCISIVAGRRPRAACHPPARQRTGPQARLRRQRRDRPAQHAPPARGALPGGAPARARPRAGRRVRRPAPHPPDAGAPRSAPGGRRRAGAHSAGLLTAASRADSARGPARRSIRRSEGSRRPAFRGPCTAVPDGGSRAPP